MGFAHRFLVMCIEGTLIKHAREALDKRISLGVRYIWSKFQKIDNNKIVFMTYSGNYECNPKYIAEELIRRNCPYELIWVVPAKGKYNSELFPPQIKQVRRYSFQDAEARATAKIWIDNAVNFPWAKNIPKKRKQIYLNTWHGSMGLKRIGAEDHKDRYWVGRAKKCGKITNYCISDSSFENDVFRSTYWPKTPILKFGHARNDILFDHSPKHEKEIRYRVLSRLGELPSSLNEPYSQTEAKAGKNEQHQKQVWETHYILYAPTFRDDSQLDCYDLDFDRLVDSLEQKFGGKWKVLMRFHFHNRAAGKEIAGNRLFVNATEYPDMQELMYIADAGITDYSSWICDFALTGKPGFIYAVDLEKYNTERGLYYPLETTPFPIATNNDEMVKNIWEFDKRVFEEKRKAFLSDKGCIEDGHAAERIADFISELMNGKKCDIDIENER